MTAMVAKMLLAINKHLNKSDYFEIISSCMHSQLLVKHAINALVKALMQWKRKISCCVLKH